jgi:hypothetical protein
MVLNTNKFIKMMNIVVFLLAAVLYSGCGEKQEERMPQDKTTINIKERLKKYSPIEVSFDENILNDEQKQVLQKFVEAAKLIDTIFWKQASYVGLSLRKKLSNSTDQKDRDFLHYLKINYGPYDRLDENKPFMGTQSKPLGAAFYPQDMTKKEFQKFISANPQLKKSFESPYTVIRRKNNQLVAVPYNQEYQVELKPVAKLLREAAEVSSNVSLKKYLYQRAKDLIENNYYQSDCDWIDLEGNLVEIVIGPYEVYEDGLMGMKAAYESFVYVNDVEEMNKLKGYIQYLDTMQKNLPVEEKYKDQKVAGLKSPLNVVYEVYTAGDTRAGVQTLAFVLPNDERVREEKGSKKVMLKNIIEAKFKTTLMPIARKILNKDDLQHVSFYAYFNETILHELCHALGMNYVISHGQKKLTVNKALKELYSPIEEAKATVLGIYNIPLLIEEGWIPAEKEIEFYTTHLAGMFRSLRFGLHEAHGLGTLLQLNFLREKEAFVYNEKFEKFSVDKSKVRIAMKDLAQKLLILQGDGDYQRVKEFLQKYGKVDVLIEKTVEKLTSIPTDIEPIFKYDG